MSTTPSYVPPIYEEFSPHIETKELPGFHILHVHIPAGFARDQIGAKVERDYGRVRVFGERPLENNKRGRFNVIHQVPGNCDVNRIKGHCRGGIVITMAKKDISSEVPPQEELEPTQPEEPPKPPTEPYPEEKDQQEESNIPPKSTPQVEQEKSTPAEVEAPKDKEDVSEDSKSSEEEADDFETSTPTNVTDKSMAEEGQEGISEEPKSTIQSKEQVDETLTPPEATEVPVPQKGQEGIPQKATFTTDAKHQTEDKFIAGPSAEDGVEKQQSVGKKATEEEEEEERKESAIVDKSFVPKTTEKKVKEKEISGEIGEGIHRKVITDSGGKRIKQVAASASQAVTSLAKRFNINEEDKQKLIYMGAAVIVVALGVYVSYKLHSSHRL